MTISKHCRHENGKGNEPPAPSISPCCCCLVGGWWPVGAFAAPGKWMRSHVSAAQFSGLELERSTDLNKTIANIHSNLMDFVFPFLLPRRRLLRFASTNNNNNGETEIRNAVPIGKPITTIAHNTSATSLYISWKPPPPDTILGEFLGYRITYRTRDKNNNDLREIYIRDSSVEVRKRRRRKRSRRCVSRSLRRTYRNLSPCE